MIYKFEDPCVDWEAYCEDRERDSLYCENCGEPIYDRVYTIDGSIYCRECVDELFSEEV